jgi:hypothetical protein
MFKNVTVVTSFSEDGWETYAKDMVWSIAEHWDPAIKVIAYYHDFDINTKDLPKSKSIEYRNLNDLNELIEFRERFKEYDGTMGGKTSYTFRLDAIKFCHKVFAITDCAFNLSETMEKPGWLVWLDADTVAVRPLNRHQLLQSLPKNSDIVHLGRKNFTYSETSFIGFNLESQPPVDFLGDFLGAYLSGELFHYREWHDGFIFERLITIYKAHGLKFHDWTGSLDIKSMTEGKQAFDLFPLSDYVKHKKGAKKKKSLKLPLSVDPSVHVSVAEAKPIPIVIQPRDCMPKEDIQNNVKQNTKIIKKWVGRASPNDEVALIVSGGSSTDFDKVRSIIKMEGEERTKVVCVKHSYPTLLKEGISPWACVILDPRPIEGISTHGVVRKDLFKTIDKKTIFMPASMTDPSITKLIKKKTNNIIGWHAFTQSLQENQKDKLVNNAVKVNEELGIAEGATMITGGTCAAMRSIGIMHTLGFRKFHLFGYDCSFPEPSEEEKEKLLEDGKPKYLKVGIKDKEYWTTGELIAMAQDCEKLFSKEDVDMKINFHGEDTLVASCWELSPVHQLKHYHQVLDL